MAKIREIQAYKETVALVPNFLGRDRGKIIVVKVTPSGVWLKPKGLRQNSATFVGWSEILSYGTDRDAKEALKRK